MKNRHDIDIKATSKPGSGKSGNRISKRTLPLTMSLALSIGFSAVAGELLSSCHRAETDQKSDSDKVPNSDKGATPSAKPTEKKAKEGEQGTAENDAKRHVIGGDLPEVVSAQKHIQDRMLDTQVILTVGDTPITVGQYRLQLKQEQFQIQAKLSGSPEYVAQFADEAKARGITLNDEEKKRYLEVAKKADKGTAGSIHAYLAKQKISDQDFDNQILRTALAYKTATAIIEDSLLNSMVNQELLVNAARKQGLMNTVLTYYGDLKRDENLYKKSMLESGLTAEQFRDQFLHLKLVELEIATIEKEAPATDSQVKDYYQNNLNKFHHGDRVRLSQILVMAPQEDVGPYDSLKREAVKAEPNINSTNVSAAVSKLDTEQKEKAQKMLDQIKGGADFAKLANEFTDDFPARQAKNGGDLGFQDVDTLIKDIGDKVKPLKPGQLVPELVRTKVGYHIFKVTDRQPAGTMNFNEVKNQLKEALMQKNATDAVGQWIKEKRHKGDIVLSPVFKELCAPDLRNPPKPD